VGLDPARIDQMFDRFTQADASVSRRYGGTGLGLAISRRLVEIMGGEIGAESDGHSGSTFRFRVALMPAESDTRSACAQPLAALERRLRVLLAEDNAANQALVTALVAPLDIQLHIVENGALAVQALQAENYDLVLMDMQMPVMDGLSAARAIRALPGRAAATPIVALTANVMPEQIEQCRAAGLQGHVTKPIDPLSLFTAIAEHAAPAEEEELPRS